MSASQFSFDDVELHQSPVSPKGATLKKSSSNLIVSQERAKHKALTYIPHDSDQMWARFALLSISPQHFVLSPLYNSRL